MDPSGTPLSGASDDELYDAYLDAALEGRLEPPEEFAARHAVRGSDLRGRLESAFRMLAPQETPAGSAPAAEDGLPFARLGDFRLLRRIGEGGMGAVYLAEQVSLGRTVALKVVRPELRGSPQTAERFRREALAVARLVHESIVTVHAVGEVDGIQFIAMEHVEGRGLDEVLAAGRVSASDAVRWAAHVARALEAAHVAGVVHRDVKPSNIRITPAGLPMLLDFGIARDAGADALTRSAPFVGSPSHAAPEQIAGETGAVDARTDVYSLGVTLYECLAGRTPWSGRTVEQVFREILTAEAPRLRSLDASISRDLELVVAKAMEKDPSRRYSSAAEFAHDLDALLEFRPVRARPASLPRRAAQWARRRPGPAAAAATLLLAAAALAAFVVAEQSRAARDRRDSAEALVADARSRIAAYRERRSATHEIERRVDAMRDRRASRYLEPAEERLMDENEDAVLAFRREREAVYHSVLDLVRQAQTLDASVAGADVVRAELYLEKWREAADAGDAAAVAYFRDRLRACDPGGVVAGEVSAAGTLSVTSDPPGAEVHLFRYAEQADVVTGGEKRLVPMPFRGANEPPPGTWALEVLAAAGELSRGDLVVSANRVPVSQMTPADARGLASRGCGASCVVRDGALRDAALPPGLRVRLTAAPLAFSAASLAGVTPLEDLRAEPGSYLVVLRRAGSDDVRVPVAVRRDRPRSVAVRLLAEGSAPEGFVRVDPESPSPLWMMEREVTSGEYLLFLNDGAPPSRSPRAADSLGGLGVWPRDESGQFVLPRGWDERWPVLGVSFDDAQAYAAWTTARAAASGRAFAFSLPTHDEWCWAGHGAGDRQYVFGNRFSARWTSCCFARQQAMPVPVLSYPVDESPFGVFDMTGSAFEWCDSWYDEGRGMRRVAGGSWARGVPEELRVWAARGGVPGSANGETGFRLVARPAAAAK